MDRLILTATLRVGQAERARELIAVGPPYPLERYQLTRHSVHVAGDIVLFVFEGHDVEWAVDELVNDPIVSAAFASWGPVLEGRPAIAHELFSWESRAPVVS
jgi:hypothetical protein